MSVYVKHLLTYTDTTSILDMLVVVEHPQAFPVDVDDCSLFRKYSLLWDFL